jgi:DNA repair protein RecO (recombination protein O)
MRSFKAEGIIIKRKNYGEADRIITILTRYHGKLTVKASGVRKITSKRSAHVELLNHANLSLYVNNKFPVLTEAEAISDYYEIKNDLAKVGFAYHFCELIDGLCPEGQEQRGVFDLLKTTLERLSGAEDTAVIVHDFEVKLLSMLGYWQGSEEHSATMDTQSFIEGIIERKLKSKRMFDKLD